MSDALKREVEASNVRPPGLYSARPVAFATLVVAAMAGLIMTSVLDSQDRRVTPVRKTEITVRVEVRPILIVRPRVAPESARIILRPAPLAFREIETGPYLQCLSCGDGLSANFAP